MVVVGRLGLRNWMQLSVNGRRGNDVRVVRGVRFVTRFEAKTFLQDLEDRILAGVRENAKSLHASGMNSLHASWIDSGPGSRRQPLLRSSAAWADISHTRITVIDRALARGHLRVRMIADVHRGGVYRRHAPAGRHRVIFHRDRPVSSENKRTM